MDLGIREVYSVSRSLLFCGLVAAATVLHAQAPEPTELERRAYVRRISVGASLAIPVFNSMKTGYASYSQESPTLESSTDATSKKHWGGGGLMLQIAFLERWTVIMNALYRKAEYSYTETQVAGDDNPNTLEDDREWTTIEGWTRLRYLDLPVLARYYSKDRHRSGGRWFFQAGPNTRSVRKIKTRRIITDPDRDVTYNTSLQPTYKRTVYGITAGFGGQIIDPLGVRVIPEVRYTRWLGLNIDVPAAHSRRDQIEFIFSLSF
jgi:hypothetical protein